MSPFESQIASFIESFQQYQLSKRGGVFIPFYVRAEPAAAPAPSPGVLQRDNAGRELADDPLAHA
ncbi:MAG: hypothetical protein IH962_02480 [Chloroflexi bacterium]|nr:hypothetical protein [Chloroflexota bacterium]